LVVSSMNFIFHFIYGISSFPLTNSISFQDGHIAPPTSESSGYFRNVNGNFTLWEYGKMPSEAGWVVQLHLTIWRWAYVLKSLTSSFVTPCNP
jgi:hypothetical protein